ncbi:uncharacterized protein J8A68_005333 [[Candida] subhashii]|uniref:Uncharacterized protein n=1 Tax=[Candida] subhashii TaxID=561895 RepID=A0A8J5UTC3_9ASCO|nr:uncharacterized protein J8A68_005333 [[Candida] subhashii]KAG7661160.1 hypothetical protein J8A68_005333 [[Candida] subhashii]
MVSVKFVTTVLLSISSSLGFQLLRDESGYSILPPTDLVLQHLKENSEPSNNGEYYDVLTTVHKNGEIVHVNLNSHEIKQTGKYKFNYDNSAYKNCDMKGLFKRTILREDNFCFNEEFKLETSQCGFEFVSYANAEDCSNEASKYSCVLDVMKQQDSTLSLKDMENVPAQVRCYYNMTDAQADKPLNGACSK